jgi:8-amino-7-oxononanoate synthase
MLEPLTRALTALERRGRLRALGPRAGVDFSSNDYLGLATSPEIADVLRGALERGVAVGAGGSRLLRGNDPEHEQLEAKAAQIFGADRALFFNSGFAANLALLSTLPQRGDLVVHDALVHASARDGMRLCRAECRPFAHNDAEACEDVVRAWRAEGGTGQVWITAETLYSMEGDTAPLNDLMRVADAHDAMLILDEAHATGVFGPQGRGLAAHLEGRANIVTLHTCGKALGLMGGLVLAPRLVTDFLVNRARPFIYATAPSPLLAAGVRAALDIMVAADERRTTLRDLIAAADRAFANIPGRRVSATQIQPIVTGSDQRATALASALQDRGFDVRAVRPPTVPEGTARLRVSITLNVTAADIAALGAAVTEELERIPA